MEPAPLEYSGWYLRGDVGVGVQTGNINLNLSPNPLIGLPADAFNSFYNPSISAAALFDVGVGYQINNWLRFDVTGEYRGGSHFQALEQVGDPLAVHAVRRFLSRRCVFVHRPLQRLCRHRHLVWRHPVRRRRRRLRQQSSLRPHGHGLRVSRHRRDGSPTGGYFSDGSKTSFAWALMTGVDFNVTQNLKLELGYRFLDYGALKSGVSHCFNGTGAGGGFSVANCGGSGNFLSTNRELYSQDFRLGLRWAFADVPIL